MSRTMLEMVVLLSLIVVEQNIHPIEIVAGKAIGCQETYKMAWARVSGIGLVMLLELYGRGKPAGFPYHKRPSWHSLRIEKHLRNPCVCQRPIP